MRVLVAEDDRGLRDVLTRGLRENGYTVDAVPDGQTAVNYLRSYDYEVAVLDWRMPGVSGLEVLQWMRRSKLPAAVLMLLTIAVPTTGSKRNSALPPARRYFRRASISTGRKSAVGPAMMTTDASLGTSGVCASTSLSMAKLSRLSTSIALEYPVRSTPVPLFSPCPSVKYALIDRPVVTLTRSPSFTFGKGRWPRRATGRAR